jgi:hypothetical protein
MATAQTFEALKLGQQARLERSQIRRDITGLGRDPAARRRRADIVLGLPPAVERASVGDVLKWMTGVRDATADRWCEASEVSPTARLCDLTFRQRSMLAAVIRCGAIAAPGRQT